MHKLKPSGKQLRSQESATEKTLLPRSHHSSFRYRWDPTKAIAGSSQSCYMWGKMVLHLTWAHTIQSFVRSTLKWDWKIIESQCNSWRTVVTWWNSGLPNSIQATAFGSCCSFQINLTHSPYTKHCKAPAWMWPEYESTVCEMPLTQAQAGSPSRTGDKPH